jgi:hypothetical protein
MVPRGQKTVPIEKQMRFQKNRKVNQSEKMVIHSLSFSMKQLSVVIFLDLQSSAYRTTSKLYKLQTFQISCFFLLGRVA